MINPYARYEIPMASKEPIRKSDMNSSVINYIEWNDLNLKELYRLYK